jgi:hypothetical protein
MWELLLTHNVWAVGQMMRQSDHSLRGDACYDEDTVLGSLSCLLACLGLTRCCVCVLSSKASVLPELQVHVHVYTSAK